jgi:rhodanese-related sulfurtransferase
VPGKTDKIIVIYCESGYRAGKARAALLQAGFQNVLHLEGDMGKWRSNRLPLEVDE